MDFLELITNLAFIFCVLMCQRAYHYYGTIGILRLFFQGTLFVISGIFMQCFQTFLSSKTILILFSSVLFFFFSGMTFAVVAILGHFSKTLLLFFIPQVINFLYSLPQLFHWIPCPRHRLPKFNEETDLREMSMTEFKKSDMKFLGRCALNLFAILKLVTKEEIKRDGEDRIRCNNLTLINFVLHLCGPLHERTLTIVILCFQIFCSVIAFLIRYPAAKLFYGEVIA